MSPNALISPSWADARLALCGFSDRFVTGPPALQNATQIHTAVVHVVAGGPDGAWPLPPAQGDGLWTASPGLPLEVRVADCVPILLWDPAGIVGAVHAGWRGTAADIAGEAIRVGVARLGLQPGACRVAIGPCISADAFEVGDEVVQGLRGAGLVDDAFGLRFGPGGRPHVDLRRANRALLVRAGVPEAAIEDVGGCTVGPTCRHHSHRRDRERSGRQRGIIALAPGAVR